METIMNYIRPELLILVPVLYFVGVGMKRSQTVSDRHIPLLLGTAGVVLAVLWVLAMSDIRNYQDALMAIFVALTQGILAAGCSVYIDQLIKQKGKGK